MHNFLAGRSSFYTGRKARTPLTCKSMGRAVLLLLTAGLISYLMTMASSPDFDSDTDLLLSQVPEASFHLKLSCSAQDPTYIPSQNISDSEDIDEYTPLKKFRKGRFNPPVDEAYLENLHEHGKAKNTKKDTMWSVGVFSTWRLSRMLNIEGKPIEYSPNIPELNKDIKMEDLDFWLARFVCEVNRVDGSPYPATSLKHICAGIQRHLRENCNRFDIALFDSPCFGKFRQALDGRMKQLNKQGVRTHKKQAEVFSIEDEQKFWESGVFNWTSSKGLFNAIYFYTSKVFALRSADEHCTLTVDQFQFGKNAQGEYVRFLGKPCKNNPGGLKTSGKVSFKDLIQYASPSNPRCYVRMLKVYLSCIPKEGPFYRRPLACKSGEDPRFSVQKVGIHSFETLMQKLCQEAGIEGYHTGHSAKVRLICIIQTIKLT